MVIIGREISGRENASWGLHCHKLGAARTISVCPSVRPSQSGIKTEKRIPTCQGHVVAPASMTLPRDHPNRWSTNVGVG